MSHTIFKHPLVRMDLMVKKEYWPKLIGAIQSCECTYKEEVETKLDDGTEWICVKDISSLRGYGLGNLIGLFYGLEWKPLSDEVEDEKFYILLSLRKEKKKNGEQDREKVHSGSKGGTGGKSAGDIRFGPNSRPGGDSNRVVGTAGDGADGVQGN